MSELVAQTEGVPVPVPSLWSEPYWEGCRRHELRFQRCQSCATIPPLPMARCPQCQRDALAWERSAGDGSLYSWTVVWRPQNPAFSVPYAPSIVSLNEGFRLLSAMVGCGADALVDAMEVAVEFHPVDELITLPFFRPR